MQHSNLLVPNDLDVLKLRRAVTLLSEERLYRADSRQNLNAPVGPPSWETPLLHRQLVFKSKVFLETLSLNPMLQVQPQQLAPDLPLPLSTENVSLQLSSVHNPARKTLAKQLAGSSMAQNMVVYDQQLAALKDTIPHGTFFMEI